MKHIELDGQRISINEEGSLLDALLDAGIAAPHGCKSGVCQSCRTRAVAGEVPAAWQEGLSEGDRERGWFLACRATPVDGLSLSFGEGQQRFTARCLEHVRVSPDVVRLTLALPEGYGFRAGQYASVYNARGEGRSYSIASLPSDGHLEFHVREVAGGAVSPYLAQTVREGDDVVIGPAMGDCTLLEEDAGRPLLLVALGTGLAPLLGIARARQERGETARTTLVFAGMTASRLYELERLQALADAYSALDLIPVVREGEAPAGGHTGELSAVLGQLFPSLDGHGVALAGDPGMVGKLQRQVFLAGADLGAIRADAFAPAVPGASATSR